MAKRILVPIGTSEGAEVTVPVVAALARAAGATVRLLNVQPLQRTHLGESASTLPLYGYDAGLTLEVQRRVLAYGHVHEERLESEHLGGLPRLGPAPHRGAVGAAGGCGDAGQKGATRAH